jgi:AcrR family transcriptional regulator
LHNRVQATASNRAGKVVEVVRQYSMDGRNAAVAANRQAALDAALDLVPEAGADGLTMQAVATRAGMSLRTLYNYFETKERLLAEVFAALVEFTKHEVELGGSPGADARQRLEHFVTVHFDILDTQRRHMAALLSVRGVPQLEDRIRAIRTWRLRTLRELLRACGLGGSALDRAAAAAFALTTFTTYTALTEDLGLSQRDAIRTVSETLVRLTTPPARDTHDGLG